MKKILFIALLFIISCTKTPEENFQNAVTDYNTEKDPEARLLLEKAYLTACEAVDVDNADTYLAGNNSIILKNNNITTVITSDGFREPWSEDILFSFYDPSTKILCTSDGFRAEFFQFSLSEKSEQQISRIKSVELSDDEETTIDALYIHNNILYYFYKRQIYMVDPSSYETNVIFPDMTFAPPFTKEKFLVKMAIDSDIIGLVIGNAGSYNLSLLSLVSKKKIVHNKKVASLFFALFEQKIIYIDGKTGNWSIISHTTADDKIKTIKKFSSLKDISISEKNIFYVDDDGFHITDLSFEQQYTENSLYSIKRLINNYLLIEHNHKLYLIKTGQYFEQTKKFEQLVPGFFEIEEVTAKDIEE